MVGEAHTLINSIVQSYTLDVNQVISAPNHVLLT